MHEAVDQGSPGMRTRRVDHQILGLVDDGEVGVLMKHRQIDGLGLGAWLDARGVLPPNAIADPEFVARFLDLSIDGDVAGGDLLFDLRAGKPGLIMLGEEAIEALSEVRMVVADGEVEGLIGAHEWRITRWGIRCRRIGRRRRR